MGDVARTPLFDKAAELARDSKASVSTEDKLRGYGLYKVGTTGKGEPPRQLPGQSDYHPYQVAFRCLQAP